MSIREVLNFSRPAKASAAAVARACKVTPTGVSYVVNGRPEFFTNVHRQVIKTANELGFRPRIGGRKKDLQLRRVVALVLSNIVKHKDTYLWSTAGRYTPGALLSLWLKRGTKDPTRTAARG